MSESCIYINLQDCTSHLFVWLSVCIISVKLFPTFTYFPEVLDELFANAKNQQSCYISEHVCLCSSLPLKLRVFCWWPQWPCQSSARKRKRWVRIKLSRATEKTKAPDQLLSTSSMTGRLIVTRIRNRWSLEDKQELVLIVTWNANFDQFESVDTFLSSCRMGSFWVWWALTSPSWRWWSWRPDTQLSSASS